MRRRKKVVTTTYEYFTHKFSNGVMFRETFVNGESNGQSFRPSPELRKASKKTHGQTIFRYSPGQRKEAESKLWTAVEHVDPVLIPHDDIEAFDDWDNVVSVNMSDGFTYLVHKPIPIATPMLSDYIGGYTDLEFDLKRLQAHLEAHDWVTEVDLVSIPHYNIDSGSAAVQFVVKPPQRSFDYWARKMTVKYDDYWALRVRGAYTKSYSNLPDPLKLEQFRTATRY